jgi:hypothetical protein
VYSLRTLSERVLKEKGGPRSSTIDFLFGVDCCRLDMERDIDPLLAESGKLSSDEMDWFRVWYSNEVKDLGIKICKWLFSTCRMDKFPKDPQKLIAVQQLR